MKERLDTLLCKRGLAESRAKAQAHVMAGEVFVDGRRADKSGQPVGPEAEIEIRSVLPRFVSRGGEKLDAALTILGIDARGLVALDVGSSTGGFADCLLQRGAARVYAVDVGKGQLDAKLRSDPRVALMEGINARFLKPDDLPEKVDLVVLDLSFISLKLVLPAVLPLVKPGGLQLPLVKPQFEVGRGRVGKGGVVRDPSEHRRVLRDIAMFLYNSGADVRRIVPSPIRGPKGNREFFLFAALSPQVTLPSPSELDDLIERALYGQN
jgi:23S rRNA (cytidine1920-2'-O)/16S rRNA (cytidine1409-2'-O)-methyltransferase